MYRAPEIFELALELYGGLLCASDLIFGDEGEVGSINDPMDYGDLPVNEN